MTKKDRKIFNENVNFVRVAGADPYICYWIKLVDLYMGLNLGHDPSLALVA